MAGNREGALKTRAKMIKDLGSIEAYHEFMSAMARKGGKAGGGGFASNPELAKVCGHKGGSISRSWGAKVSQYDRIRRKREAQEKFNQENPDYDARLEQVAKGGRDGGTD